MQQDDQAVATKADIRMLMDAIGKMYDDTANWEDEIRAENVQWKEELKAENAQWKEELKRHMTLVTETILSEFRSIHQDKIHMVDDKVNNHEKRIHKIETRLAI
jgi:flagellar basal body-associated protein FliL